MIDDDEGDQWIIKESMEALNAGDNIAFAEDGEKALAQLELHFTSNHPVPRLIILDLNMPVMNGITTLTKLKEDKRFRNIPVVIFSTSINPFEQEKCMALGAHTYITKPISIDESIRISETFLSFCA